MADKAAYDMIVDYISGNELPNVGTEEIRQSFERFLVETKGYLKSQIRVDADIEITIGDVPYQSQLDLLVSIGGRPFMIVKCAAGSLESREREVISASRIYAPSPIPCAVVSDGRTAVIYDAVSGKKIGQGLERIPSRPEAEKMLSEMTNIQISEKKQEKEKLIFRSYDSMNVNVSRKIQGN